MTPDELARVPEGGMFSETELAGGATHIYRTGYDWITTLHNPENSTPEATARQIVGSVNAAILAPYVESLLHSHGAYNYNKAKSDYDFWLNYAKGNA